MPRAFTSLPRTLSLLSLLCGIVLAAVPIQAQTKPSPHPRVLGFERFHAAGNDAVGGGLLLLGDLNCTSCHATDNTSIAKKQAPILDEIGSRARPEYLARFLANPQAVKVGTSMPNVFAGLPEAEAKQNAEALAHFLATTGQLNDTTPSRQAATRGEILFHTVGCTACHDARKEGVKPFANSIPLGTPSKKYTLPGMVKFLNDPLHIRPSGRMPNLNLSSGEVTELASFLLGDLAGATALDYAYYEGSWDKLPDFGKLKPVAGGATEKIDVSVAKRKENFGLRFDGQIQIDKEGEYTFYVTSDDGSRITIDGKIAVNHDNVHAPSTEQGKVKLTAGKHSFSVEYFEKSGGEELKAEIEGPGLSRRELESIIAVPAPVAKPDAPKPWVIDAQLAEKGKQIFTTAGCASCHQLKQEGKAIVSSLKAKPLAELAVANTGCSSESPSTKNPYFAFNAAQQKAVSAAIASLKQAPAATAEQSVHANFVRFNCYGCHSRGTLGGIEEDRSEWFQGAYKEAGDEGRIPPQLSDVGAKLRPEWLKTVLEQGTKVRPNVFTRMPKFGPSNLGDLHGLLIQADKGKVAPAPKVDVADTDKKFKASGRFMSGAQGIGCIKCHTFNGKGMPGLQVMDLNVMAKRLNDDWFYQYMLNPPALRPGTRMPAGWPSGQSLFPKVLGGDTPKQIRAVWAYLLDGEKAQIPVGMVEAKIELLPIDEPIIYRNFLDGAGPRAIGVGFPEKVNYAWDANHMRMATIWQGAFIDAALHWVGRGPGYQKPLGDIVYQGTADVPLAVLTSNTEAWPATSSRDEKAPGFAFKGYHLDEKRRPTFKYEFGDVKVMELPVPKVEGEVVSLVRTLNLTSDKPVDNLYFLAAVGPQIAPAKEKGWYTLGESLRIRIDAAGEPTIRTVKDGRVELLVPVKFDGGKAKIVQEYEW